MRGRSTKIILGTIFLCLFSLISDAQIGYNYAQYDLGVSAGMNQFFGDIGTLKTTGQVAFSFNYNQTPFVNYVAEVQAGQLAGGNKYKDRYGREFQGSYTAGIFRVQVQLGEIMDYSKSPITNFFKNVYLSGGLGLLQDKITNINRYAILVPGFYTGGVDNSTEFFFPTRIGYEFKIFNQYNQPSVRIDFAYEYNFVMSDNLDGFTAGHSKDGFQQVTVGLKFAIGGLTSYRKEISYQ